MSRKGGLSLVRRKEHRDAVSEILGDLDGHLVRSWIVSMGDTRHDDDVFCLDVLLQDCRGVFFYRETRRISRRQRLHQNSIIIFVELLIEETTALSPIVIVFRNRRAAASAVAAPTARASCAGRLRSPSASKSRRRTSPVLPLPKAARRFNSPALAP